MSHQPSTCPECGSAEIHFRKPRGDWACDACLHAWSPADRLATPAESSPESRPRLFLSYGRRDAEEIADHLEADLALLGFEI
jgi:hypothetical protein